MAAPDPTVLTVRVCPSVQLPPEKVLPVFKTPLRQ
jgi:hypothetical protein